MMNRGSSCTITRSWPSWPGVSKRAAQQYARAGWGKGDEREEKGVMHRIRFACWAGFSLTTAGLLISLGCYHTPVDTSEYARGPAPLRMPAPAEEANACACYED